MQDDTSLLDSAIMTTAYDLMVDNEDRSDRDPAFGQSFFCFVNRRLQKFIHGLEEYPFAGAALVRRLDQSC